MTGNLSEQAAAFLTAYREKEVAINTIKTYRGDLNALLHFIGSRELSKETMIEYKAHLAGKYKPETSNHRLRTANLFVKFLGRQECSVKPIPVKRNLTPENLMALSDFERMLRYAAKRNRPRTYAIMETLAGTGIRFAELKFITVETLRAGKATVTNKNVVRDVPLAAVKKELTAYCKENRITQGVIFKTRNGTPISNSQVARDLKKIAGAARVNKAKIHPHAFRHLFAINFLASGGELTDLQNILGHKSLDTTSIYTRVTAKKLGQEMAATSILKKINRRGNKL
jgi:integrase/recombinase XerD